MNKCLEEMNAQILVMKEKAQSEENKANEYFNTIQILNFNSRRYSDMDTKLNEYKSKITELNTIIKEKDEIIEELQSYPNKTIELDDND